MNCEMVTSPESVNLGDSNRAVSPFCLPDCSENAVAQTRSKTLDNAALDLPYVGNRKKSEQDFFKMLSSRDRDAHSTLRKRSNSLSSFLSTKSTSASENKFHGGLNWLSLKLNLLLRLQGRMNSARTNTSMNPYSCDSNENVSTLSSVNQNFNSRQLLATIVPESIQNGCSLLRITKKKVRQRKVSLDPTSGYLMLDKNTGKAYKKLCVDDIKEIRQGRDARNYREQYKISSENEKRWFTIIYCADNKLKAMHMISPTLDAHNQWIMALEGLKTYRLNEFIIGLNLVCHQGEKMIDYSENLNPWEKLEKEQSAQLDLGDVHRMCQMLHLNASMEFLEETFQKADADRSGKLSFEEFQHFVSLLKTRSEIVDIFKEYTSGSDKMSLEQFRHFLSTSQKARLDTDSIRTLYVSFCSNDDSKMGLIEFTSFLLSPHNSPVVPVIQDMSRPLNEYLISSSHNTYLLGKQFGGESSIEGYIRSLQRGCKCIEIDCWDGPNGPVVCHGHTFTSMIKFNDVIDAIRKYAFVVSPYPLFISLEIHCCPDQQRQMVSYMKQAFGDTLVMKPVTANESILPSPEDLLNKILLKVKCSATPLHLFSTDILKVGITDSSTDTTESSELENSELTGLRKGKRRMKNIIVQELQQLAPYARSLKFRNFSLPESKTYSHIFSFSERTIKKHGKAMVPRLSKHNLRYLCRVYPGPLRVGSTNFNPQVYWRLGVQMVALNWQTYDTGLQINDALFMADPPTGYLLKPPCQRIIGTTVGEEGLPRKIKLTIDVISGQQLRRARELSNSETLSPYVEIQVHSMEESPFRWCSKVVHENGFRPFWGETMVYESIISDDFYSMIRFLVHHRGSNGNDSIFANFTCPIDRLQQGYRHIRLLDMQGENLLFSSLFLKIKKEDI